MVKMRTPRLSGHGGRWSAACGTIHAVWLWRRLRMFTVAEMPERIDSTIVLALTFILWFCVLPLIALM